MSFLLYPDQAAAEAAQQQISAAMGLPTPTMLRWAVPHACVNGAGWVIQAPTGVPIPNSPAGQSVSFDPAWFNQPQ